MKALISLRRLPDAWASFILVFALSGLLFTPYPSREQAFRDRALEGPSWAHPLGIDGLGRDFFSRLWEGSGHTVALAVIALLITLGVAALLVSIERIFPNSIGRFVRMGVGLWVAFPVIFIGLLLLVFLNPSPFTLVLAVGFGNLAFAFRQLRVFWMATRNALYVQSSEVLGSRGWALFRWAIWPNLVPDIFALARLLFAMSALELSGLAFLGLIGDPDFAELGAILKQNQPYLYQAPALAILPGAILSLILLSVHLSRFHR
ncbi:ABC transporter permease [Puniceicoccales bacterium CK1056]|uniref:ABC transporter permease n=1 Tax=Oceanipulchritudo coccoides TaxID=2706888 RepID=A0A6B2LWP2_9BACT|nr:ABC transporter permease subunit [Oceanipulchritudo coccoides]NDV60831.1 ABC transporter permease [Oceanipulchritudo coccoides]